MTDNKEIWGYGPKHVRDLPIEHLTHAYLTNFLKNVSVEIAGQDKHDQAKAELTRRKNMRGQHQRRQPFNFND